MIAAGAAAWAAMSARAAVIEARKERDEERRQHAAVERREHIASIREILLALKGEMSGGIAPATEMAIHGVEVMREMLRRRLERLDQADLDQLPATAKVASDGPWPAVSELEVRDALAELDLLI